MLSALAFAFLGFQASSEHAVLTLSFTGFRNLKGQLRVTIFDDSQRGKGYPGDIKYARETRVIDLSAPNPHPETVNVEFAGLPAGTYAIAALHDENRNNRMDTHWYGKPREGGAASNNPRPRFGPPRYRDAKFTLNAAEKRTLSITVQYP
jgi:uncharacterized protein (DUF2141 family)